MKAAPEVIKLAPHDLPAERYLIGTILIKNETLALVQDVLEPRDFYDQRNRLVFRAMLSLSAAGKPIDEITLGDALKAHGDDFEKVGGRAFLATLTEGMAALEVSRTTQRLFLNILGAAFYASWERKSLRRAVTDLLPIQSSGTSNAIFSKSSPAGRKRPKSAPVSKRLLEIFTGFQFPRPALSSKSTAFAATGTN
jgi:DnaB-like helicase N terminal domain